MTHLELPDDAFEPAPPASQTRHVAAAAGGGRPWQDAWQRLRRRRPAMISAMALGAVVIAAIGALWLSPYDPSSQDISSVNQPPGGPHLLGTDALGRDLFSRLLMGLRVSLTIAFFAGLLDLTLGVVYGLLSGLGGARVDAVLQRVLEVVAGIPTLVVLVLMLTIFEPGLTTIILAMVVTGWIPMARLVRAQALRLKEQEFILAAQVLGASRIRIATWHVLPNSLGLILVQMMFSIPTAIFFEAFLSFIGLGLRPPVASLGTLLNEGFETFTFLPFQMLAPAVALSVVMVAFNLLADGLRDAFDPKGVSLR